MKYEPNLRTLCCRVAVTLTIYLMLAPISGCAPSMLTGLFVNHDNPGEVDMLRLVESPPGHLTGSVVVSSLNSDGSRKKDTVYDVSGTITGPNVSLQLGGGLAFLGASANIVGNLKGNALTLSFGNQTQVLRETSQKQYDKVLASLDEAGQHIAMVERAKSAVNEVESNDQKLNVAMEQYIAWGRQRVDNVSNVRQWYANRIASYTKYLQTIRPLAAQGFHHGVGRIVR